MKTAHLQVLMTLAALTGGLGARERWPRDEQQARHYCGRNLARALALLCDDVEDKRSGGQFLSNALAPYIEDVEYEARWPWAGWRRRGAGAHSKRQLVNECCYKPCTLADLMSYCTQ